MAAPRSPRARQLLWRRQRRSLLDARASVAPNERDDRLWTLGQSADVEWIQRQTTFDCTITSAIPPVFAAYATVVRINWGGGEGDALTGHLLEILRQYGPSEWWLGYLDTGTDDVIFPRADPVYLYADWRYVFVQAGPEQALTWREELPEVMFPIDRSWLVSTLWDDTWTCVGGPDDLITVLRSVAALECRPINLGDHVAPPGHDCI